MSTAWKRWEPYCLFGRPPRSSLQLHSCRRVIAFVFVQPGNTANRLSGRERPECYLLSLWVAHLKTTLNAASLLWEESEGDYFCHDEFLWNDTLRLLISPEFDRQRFLSLKGDVTLIFSFLVFLSRNEMFTRFPSQRLWNKPAAVVGRSDTVGVFKPRAETHLFSAASQPALGPTLPDSFFHFVYFLQSVISSLQL